jgi:putative addiction module component (TIGR02574 family)
MSTSELISGITQMLKKVKDERLLKAVYSLVKEYIDESDSILTHEQKQELDRRLELHLKGKSKNLSFSQVKKEAFGKLKR